MAAIPSQSPARRGFTLTEMMISVALVLVLMLAITKIFSITSTTIGASQGFAAATRDARAAQAVFTHDLGSLAPDSPFIWIRSDLPLGAFRNAADAAGDRDGDPLTSDIDGDGVEGGAVLGEKTPMFAADARSHRQDRLSFCARDRFYRQTGNNLAYNNDGTVATTASAPIVADMSGVEAWITYGHLTLPNNSGQFNLVGSIITDPTALNSSKAVNSPTKVRTYPGVGNAQSNPLNFYASQWVLGRVAMLMVQPTASGSAAAEGSEAASKSLVYDSSTGMPQELFGSNSSTHQAMEPFSDVTKASYPNSSAATANLPLLFSARYDLVSSDMTTSRTRLQDYISSGAAVPWYDNMLNYRFQVNPFAVKPINAASAAQQVPIFVPACSQFIVEYAGDFVAQNANGTLNTAYNGGTLQGLEPDGQIDFRYDTTTGTRQIQWYGMPRSVGGGQTVDVRNGDVVPLGAFVSYLGSLSGANYTTAASQTAVNADFDTSEHFVTYASDGTPSDKAVQFENPYPASMLAGDPHSFDSYYAAFDPATIGNPKRPRPKMIRITMTVDRPELAGRSADAQVFEYVFNLP